MDLLLDENLPRSLSTLLRRHGHRVKALRGIVDADIFATCVKSDRVLLTLDLDFANIRRYPPRTHPGIVVIRLKRQSARRIVQAVTHFLRVASLERCRGVLTIVEETDYRIRAQI